MRLRLTLSVQGSGRNGRGQTSGLINSRFVRLILSDGRLMGRRENRVRLVTVVKFRKSSLPFLI